MKQFIYGAVLCLVALTIGWYLGERSGERAGRLAAYEELVAAGVVADGEAPSALREEAPEAPKAKPEKPQEPPQAAPTPKPEKPKPAPKTKPQPAPAPAPKPEAPTAAPAPAEKRIDNTVVECVAYEQNGNAHEATISLKNNTDKDIKRVQFRIVYSDMQGKQLDYKDFDKRVTIAAGLVRQIEIERFQRSSLFDSYYYKDNKSYSDAKPYKITYQLLDYQ